MSVTTRPMKLLLACEYYHPSRGGVQEVMRQLAERFVAAGHDVTVATTHMPERTFTELNGVKIAPFAVSGKGATGISGDVDRYREFLAGFDGDAILIKAAQQWTFDAAWPVLDRIKTRKVFIPCGFSGLYEPAFSNYFAAMPAILAKFDDLIFYAERYRDVDFARKHGLKHINFLPNGASETEFATPIKSDIRARLGIPDEALLVITVGTPINAKGHPELAEAFGKLEVRDRPLALVLNGQWPLPPLPPPKPVAEPTPGETAAPVDASPLVVESARMSIASRARGFLRRAGGTFRQRGPLYFIKRVLASIFARSRGRLLRVADTLRLEVARLRTALFPQKPAPEPEMFRPKTIDDHIEAARAQDGKTVLKTNLPRKELIEAFFAADLFVFASNIEYSPLVLFEACAAGLPYLTVPVGNAEEIVRWTGGGEVCPAAKDALGYTRVDPAVLAQHIQALLDDPDRRAKLGAAGRDAWQRDYNWAAIAPRYEAILRGEGEPVVEAREPDSVTQGTHARA